MDVDSDGGVSTEEMVAAMYFEMADADKSGTLDKHEFTFLVRPSSRTQIACARACACVRVFVRCACVPVLACRVAHSLCPGYADTVLFSSLSKPCISLRILYGALLWFIPSLSTWRCRSRQWSQEVRSVPIRYRHR